MSRPDHGSRAPAGSRVGRGALIAYTAALAYASLSPFIGWRAPEAFTLFTWPRYLNPFDITLNVLAYVPFGGMLAAYLMRSRERRGVPEASLAVFGTALIVSLALSAALEILQSLLPVRVCSAVDLIANTAGAAIGASMLVSRWGRRWLAALLHWRHRHFAIGEAVSWGLLLLAAWFVSQLNPVIPFFEAGHIANPYEVAAGQPYDPLVLLPQAVGITLNVCGFSLWLTLLFHPVKRMVLNVLVVLALGFFVKVFTASLMLKVPQLVGWLAPATVIGLTAGVLLFAYFSRLRHRWRALAATLFLFAGGAMVKMAGIYGAFDETLRLVSWPSGHLASFAVLSRWLHEAWPVLACLLSAWIFVRRRGQ